MAPTTRSFTRQANNSIPSPSYYDSPPSLLNIVRRANARYSHIASSMREALPKAGTSNARKRAALLKLTVNTDAARKLDQRHVSVLPLPIIEVGPSPTALATPPIPEVARASGVIHAPQPTRPVLKCVIPARPSQEQQVPSSINSGSASAIDVTVSAFSESSFIHLESPDSPRSLYYQVSSSTEGEQSSIPFAPAAIRGQSVPWRPVTSRWSISTAGEGEADIDLDMELEEINSQPLILEVPARPMAPLPGAQRKHARSYAVQIDRQSSPILGQLQSSQICIAEPVRLQGKRKTSYDFTGSEQDITSLHADGGSPAEKRPKYMRKDWVRKSSPFTITYNERGAF